MPAFLERQIVCRERPVARVVRGGLTLAAGQAKSSTAADPQYYSKTREALNLAGLVHQAGMILPVLNWASDYLSIGG